MELLRERTGPLLRLLELLTKPQNKTPYDLLTGDKLENNSDFKTCEKPVSQVEKIFLEELEKLKRQEKEATDAAESLRKEATYDIQNANTSSTYLLNIVSTPLSTAGPSRAFNDGEISYPDDPLMPHLKDIYTSLSKGILLIHLMMMKVCKETIIRIFSIACFLSQIEPKKISQALEDKRWVDAMQEELFQFQIQKVWILIDFPFGKKAIRTKWVNRNKKDERGVVVRNKARLVSHGHMQEEGIYYDEVFAPVARIEAIRIFLAFASFMGFIVYQMDVNSTFLYGTIDEQVYVSQPPGFVDPKFPNKCLSAKRTAWIEFSFSMASAVIYLATSRKFNFSKYIFDSMVKNVDNPTKFLMYLRFLQVVMDNQVDDMTIHNTRYTSPSLTQKVFANMKRVGKAEEESKEARKEKEVKIFRVQKAEKGWGKIESIDADEGITLVDVKTNEEVVSMDAESQGRINQEEVNTTKKANFLDEQIAQRLHDEEVQKATARDKQEKADSERALELQKQYDDKEEILIGVLLLNKGMNYDKVRPIFERECKKVQTLFKPDKDVEEPKKNRVADETLLQESFKKLKVAEVSGSESTQEIPSNDPKEMTKADAQNILEIVPEPEFKVEALQVKYPIIDWEIHTEGSRTYWKIIRVRGITKAYQRFKDMLRGFDREDLDTLWNLVKEKFNANDVLWKLQRYMHAPLTWKLYTDCGVHHMSSTRGHDIFMLIEKDYPLSNAVMILMLSGKLQVEKDNEMARDLVMKIFLEANKPKRRSLDTSSK
nr:retrovirus-related Pol polyprotein from transposon TNT 1-94 [Tanacetum cinerariifolium]